MGSSAGNDLFTALTRIHAERLGSAAHLPRELLAAGGDALTAHPHVDSNTGRLVTFSYRVKPSVGQPPLPPYINTTLTFWELGPDCAPVASKDFTLRGFAFLHDFAVTEDYYVIFQNPVTVDNAPYLLGTAPAASCVR